MDKQTYIRDVAEHVGEEIVVRGWLYNRTDKGRLQFLQVRDGSGVIQAVVFQKNVSAEAFEAAARLTQESSIVVRGTVRQDERAPGGYELDVSDLRVVHQAQEYPIQPKEHGVDFLMEWRHLWIRTPTQAAILRVRAHIIRAIREYLDTHGFINADTPVITPSACEGTTTLFGLEYFDTSAYLTQSGQLYNEATAMALGKVYAFGPTFRAEKSKTRRHLTEFWMVEPEMAYVDLEGNMEVMEEFVTHVVRSTLANCAAELKELGRDTTALERIEPPFPRLQYDEAVKLLNQWGVPMEWGDDFGAPQETAIGEHFDKPVMVHRYPSAIKAFYMQPDPDRPELSLSVDMIAAEGYGEIIGGGQRIHDLELLERRLEEHNLPREPYEWYLDLRRYGSVPHSGFGLGIERTVAWITGVHHIRETIPFPRTLGRVWP
ncbi:MAG: asparagine--tRNA ligase [Anaerolineae bacterium]|nr:asparagine--tRNA ligase [Anaerolineae bacterium]